MTINTYSWWSTLINPTLHGFKKVAVYTGGHYDPPWKMILGTTFEVKLTCDQKNYVKLGLEVVKKMKCKGCPKKEKKQKIKKIFWPT